MNNRIKMIDYIKGVCILMVIVMHTEIYSSVRLMSLMPFYVDLAVPCFFMLSGYTLALRINKRISSGDSIKKQIGGGIL